MAAVGPTFAEVGQTWSSSDRAAQMLTEVLGAAAPRCSERFRDVVCARTQFVRSGTPSAQPRVPRPCRGEEDGAAAGRGLLGARCAVARGLKAPKVFDMRLGSGHPYTWRVRWEASGGGPALLEFRLAGDPAGLLAAARSPGRGLFGISPISEPHLERPGFEHIWQRPGPLSKARGPATPPPPPPPGAQQS